MDICANNHEEICFDGRRCPMCDMKEDFESCICNLEDRVIECEDLMAEERKDS